MKAFCVDTIWRWNKYGYRYYRFLSESHGSNISQIRNFGTNKVEEELLEISKYRGILILPSLYSELQRRALKGICILEELKKQVY